MPAFLRQTSHPLLLMACAVAGALLGMLSPAWSVAAGAIGRLAVNLLDMAALPLLGVATAFGLRKLMALPQRGRRAGLVLATAALTLWLCGLVGALAGQAAGLGRHLAPHELERLGQLVQQVGGQAEQTGVTLRPARHEDRHAGVQDDPPEDPTAAQRSTVRLPDNVYATLARGELPAVMFCALAFGLAFAMLDRGRTQAFSVQLETIYRALERLIQQANHLLPLLVFGMAAHLAARTDTGTLILLGGLFGALLLASLFVGGLALALVCRQARCSTGQALAALKVPLLISLVSPSPVSAIPLTIDALSAKLGFARGVVELLVPTGAVFLRAGGAIHIAVVVVFVAQLYGRSLGPLELLLLGSMAAAAALTVTGTGPYGTLSAAAVVLAWLRLPPEAVLPVLLVVDRLCDGARNLTSLLCIAAVTAVVSGGLPSESRESPLPTAAGPVRLVIGRPAAAAALACVLLAGALSMLIGVGVGLRQARGGSPAAAQNTELPR
ncbi:Na+/H+-dicarboxylate symporter [Sphaerotilus hippei]|uniref:Na+/H+-dicarboxylate symporter n=1 Tax=Sphaerotilus hippei TaxID=744406 RepID=A0A318H3E1_9BURK|nr:cation:dicarboxylase symporter family transporter [Sphaerotilus hippei]PXW97484.1 Na+/H+-dicarboxylate symporter [Sphaerotilus hippei]